MIDEGEEDFPFTKFFDAKSDSALPTPGMSFKPDVTALDFPQEKIPVPLRLDFFNFLLNQLIFNSFCFFGLSSPN